MKNKKLIKGDQFFSILAKIMRYREKYLKDRLRTGVGYNWISKVINWK